MGLALHDPSDPLPGDLALEHRHFPPGPGLTRSKVQLGQSKYHNWAERREQHLDDGFGPVPVFEGIRPRRKLHPHQLAKLSHAGSRPARPSYWSSIGGRKVQHRTREAWGHETGEGQDLARSRVRLPSDANRLRRTPSLERQDAFRDAATVKRRASRQLSSCSFTPVIAGDEALDVAELYRLGLLYDNEHERGSGFGLDAIVHDDAPVYSLNIRKDKKRGQRKGKAVSTQRELPLYLSFAALSEDDALAQYLISPDEYESMATDEAFSEVAMPSPATVPLTAVIHELESSTHSLCSGCTKPLNDNNNNNNNDDNTDNVDTPGATDIPELVLDNDDEDAEDWSILTNTGEEASDRSTTDTPAAEANEEAEAEGGSDDPDTWIMLRRRLVAGPHTRSPRAPGSRPMPDTGSSSPLIYYEVRSDWSSFTQPRISGTVELQDGE